MKIELQFNFITGPSFRRLWFDGGCFMDPIEINTNMLESNRRKDKRKRLIEAFNRIKTLIE